MVPVGLLLLAALLPIPRSAHAQEKKVSLLFTGELLSQIVTDNFGEQTAEILERFVGLSPAVRNAHLQRSGGRVALFLTVSGVDDLPVNFQFTIDKMDYYRMLTARADINGMTGALQEAKRHEPLLRGVGYRFDGRYSIIDLTLDLSAGIDAARELRIRKEAEEKARAETEAKAAAAKAAEEARAAQRAKAAEEARAAAKAAAEAEARATAPEEKPRASQKETAVPAPPKEIAHLSARALGRDPAPVLDGMPTDKAWREAPQYSFEVQGASGKRTVTAQALWSPDRLWLLLRWPDKTRDTEHRPWVWSKDQKAYVAGREVEDVLALSFDKEGRMGECMLAGTVATTDLWTWRAGRTDPSGHAEDATMTLGFQRIPRANSYLARNGRTVWIKEDPDDGAMPYQTQIVGSYAGERMPRYIPRTPSGSMADVTAKGSWQDGFWTVELSRRLSTGDPADVVFAPGRDSLFSVAVFDSREGIDHSTSKELTLKLE